MEEAIFRDWLLAVVPRFPRLTSLATAIADDHEWPSGSDETKLTSRLNALGRTELLAALVEALESFELTCVPSMPDAALPWEWHSQLLVEQSKASTERHSANRDVPTYQYRFELGQKLAELLA